MGALIGECQAALLVDNRLIVEMKAAKAAFSTFPVECGRQLR